MKDLARPFWIKFKGVLFLFIGLTAGGLIIAETPTLRMGVLLAITIWCFCRFYYFAFYVIERYVDSEYRFSGLISFIRYMARSRARGK